MHTPRPEMTLGGFVPVLWAGGPSHDAVRCPCETCQERREELRRETETR